ncbi:MAG: ATP-dependent DNA ligase [Candidatus Diapherotrites archaeon]|nr:ATP-dependent DNA ligase [Candidatus Diapherotrites archaeon]
MDFAAVAETLSTLEETPSRLEMTEIVASLLKSSGRDLRTVVLFIRGRVFPPWDPREIGVAQKSMIKCVSTATGTPAKKVEETIAALGDTGLAAEALFTKKPQTTLTKKKMSLAEIHSSLEKMASWEGKGTQEKKGRHVIELLNSVSPNEVKYLVRLVLGEMRVGVGEGIMRDAIAKAFGVPAAEAERAFSLINDYSEVAEIARTKGEAGLKKIGILLFRPLRPMLAQTVHSVQEALDNGCRAWEYKYDGMRIQAHIKNGEVRVFTRRLDDVTHQFPDVAEAIKNTVTAKEAIIEGETVAVDESERPRPFQFLSRRIKRKYKIDEMVRDIPVITYLFDCMYLDGKNLTTQKMKGRRAALNKIVTEGNHVKFSRTLITNSADKAESFYKESLKLGHEGVMAKNLGAAYKPGSRVGYMYKLKPVTETLDLVIVAAEWGEGRRANWLGSYLLACRDPDTNEFLSIGRMATGAKDEQLQYLTDTLKPTIEFQKGKFVKLRPTLVVEAGYQEIQKSPTYESGYALRFPRLITIREDRAPEECDSLDRVASLHERFTAKK